MSLTPGQVTRDRGDLRPVVLGCATVVVIAPVLGGGNADLGRNVSHGVFAHLFRSRKATLTGEESYQQSKAEPRRSLPLAGDPDELVGTVSQASR